MQAPNKRNQRIDRRLLARRAPLADRRGLPALTTGPIKIQVQNSKRSIIHKPAYVRHDTAKGLSQQHGRQASGHGAGELREQHELPHAEERPLQADAGRRLHAPANQHVAERSQQTSNGAWHPVGQIRKKMDEGVKND